ncbi:MAG: hypothetical protein PUK05_02090 [Peptoniphilaceae bacterium]|nr:hypothetical protein [Peptoniphilaceae bacterium]MDY5765628.1 hypothetical protein [Peptoniphilaceae bacterium]
MKSFRKIGLSMFLLFVFLFYSPDAVIASGEEVMRAPACPVSRYYSPSSTSRRIRYGMQTHEAKNNTSTAQSFTVGVSRKLTYTGTVSTSAEANLIIGTVGVSAEIGYGRTTSENFTVKVEAGPYKTVVCEVGSYLASTSGNIVSVDQYCNRTSTPVSVSATTGRCVEWNEK